MTVRVRIAPSPTGNLHIGTARTAVFNWLFARHHGGQFILRVEDTDTERSRPEFTQNITEGLQWLGLNWDEGPFFQSERLDLYRQAIQTLLDKGLAYRAYETPEELDEMKAAQVAKKQAKRYDNGHRNLTDAQEQAFRAEGRQAVIRFKIDDARIVKWHDLVRGAMTWKGRDLGGDMALTRASSPDSIGQPLYNLAVVVDDIDMQITHVIRGEDHIANTAKQILLYEALDGQVPEFAHTPLILNEKGAKLSKRDGVTSISDFQEMGFTAEALANYMTLLGWSAPDGEEVFTLPAAAEKFSFDRVNKAGAKFDWDKLDWLNSQYLHQIPAPELVDKLMPYWEAAGYSFDPAADKDWLTTLAGLLGPGLTRFPEAVDQGRFFFSELMDYSEAATKQLHQDGVAALLAATLEKLESGAELGSLDSGKALVNEIVKAQGIKKGLMMKSMRAALMGDMKGPDLMESWLILHQRQFDLPRLKAALELAQS